MKGEKLSGIWKILKREYKTAVCSLDHRNPYELLVATILSAQCTDARVNKITPALFRKYPTVSDMANAEQKELEEVIRPTGFYRSKARNIILSSRKIVEESGSMIPDSMDKLLELPGVARKTANVVLGTGYGIMSGIVVDTHVIRLSNRMGFTRQKDPVKIERDLMGSVPKKDWVLFSHVMISHGRAICKAKRPDCQHCPVRMLCPYPDKKP